MEIWIAILLLVLTFIGTREGFDPFLQDSRPVGYPDQTKWGDLVIAQKTLQQEINTTKDQTRKKMLIDLLNLLQFI
jgi:hypothetical protein